MRRKLIYIFLILLLCIAIVCGILTGSTHISPSDAFNVLTGMCRENETVRIIILQSRLPMTIGAILSGASLATAGLLMQTTFRNPLAGPSVLGVSSGASLGVAVVMLGFSIFSDKFDFFISNEIGSLIGAIAGCCVVMMLLLMLSYKLRNINMLLIAGIMISYFVSSLVSVLNYLAPAEGVKSFVVWGMGSFMGLTMEDLPLMTILIVLSLIASFFLCKPLNALLLGERYAINLGYNMSHLRLALLVVSGVLTAVTTAYCGPISFIGLIAPHLARMLFSTSNHYHILPGTMIIGAIITTFCAIIALIPTSGGIIPVNVVTPIIGVPIIIYILIKGNRLKYFN